MTFRRLITHLVWTASKRTDTPWLADVRAVPCPVAERDHAAEARSYAHVGHVVGTVCYARAIDDLAMPWKVGLAVHEIGHLCLGGAGMAANPPRATEADANEAGRLATGIAVEFRGPLTLEYAPRMPRWMSEGRDRLPARRRKVR